MDFIDFLAHKKQLQKIVKQTPTLSKKYVNVKQSEIQKLYVLWKYMAKYPNENEFEDVKNVVQNSIAYKSLHQELLGIDEAYLDKLKKGGFAYLVEKLCFSRPQTFAEWLNSQEIIKDNSPAKIKSKNLSIESNITKAEANKCWLMAQYLIAYPDVTKQQFEQMLQARGLAGFRKLVKEIKKEDYVDEMREWHGDYIALHIAGNRHHDKTMKTALETKLP